MKITADLLNDIKDSNQKWIKIDGKDWEFLYVDLRGKDLISKSIGVSTKNREALLTEVVLSGVKDWKNVKLGDVMDIKPGSKHEEHKNKEIDFNEEVFDILLGQNPDLIQDILTGIQEFKLKEKEDLETRKKK